MEEGAAKSCTAMASHEHYMEWYYQGKEILSLLYIP